MKLVLTVWHVLMIRNLISGKIDELLASDSPQDHTTHLLFAELRAVLDEAIKASK